MTSTPAASSSCPSVRSSAPTSAATPSTGTWSSPSDRRHAARRTLRPAGCPQVTGAQPVLLQPQVVVLLGFADPFHVFLSDRRRGTRFVFFFFKQKTAYEIFT